MNLTPHEREVSIPITGAQLERFANRLQDSQNFVISVRNSLEDILHEIARGFQLTACANTGILLGRVRQHLFIMEELKWHADIAQLQADLLQSAASQEEHAQ